MATVGSLVIQISGDTGKLERALKAAGVRVRAFSAKTEKGLGGVGNALGNLRTIGTLASAVIGGALVNSLRRAGQEQLRFVDRIGKLNQRLGVSTEFLSEMSFAAQQSGVEFEQMAIAVQRAERRFGQIAATGRGEALEGLELLGGGIADAVRAGESFEELLPRLADAIADVEDEQLRLFIAQKLFDSEGVQFLQIIGQGADALGDLRDEARRLGATISQSAADDVQEYNDAWSRLGTVVGSITRDVSVQLTRDLTPALDTTTESLASNREAISNVIAELIKLDPRSAGFVAGLEIAKSILDDTTESVEELNDELRKMNRLRGFPGAPGTGLPPDVATDPIPLPFNQDEFRRALDRQIGGIQGKPIRAGSFSPVPGETQSGIELAQQFQLASRQANLLGDSFDLVAARADIARDALIRHSEGALPLTTEQITQLQQAIQAQDLALQQNQSIWDQWATNVTNTQEQVSALAVQTVQTVSNAIGAIVATALTGEQDLATATLGIIRAVAAQLIQQFVALAVEFIVASVAKQTQSKIETASIVADQAAQAGAAAQADSVKKFGIVGIAVGVALAAAAIAAVVAAAQSGRKRAREFAEGGIVTGETLALVGEQARARPEVIAPLSKLEALLGLGERQTVVHFNVDGIDLTRALIRHFPDVLGFAGAR